MRLPPGRGSFLRVVVGMPFTVMVSSGRRFASWNAICLVLLVLAGARDVAAGRARSADVPRSRPTSAQRGVLAGRKHGGHPDLPATAA